MKYTLGIDVGLNGALVYYCADPLEIIIYDMPVNEVTVNGKKKKRIDIYELARIIDSHSKETKKAIIESVTASPQMGTTSAFAFGFASACAQMAVAANFIPMELVRPQVWKKHFGLNADKSASRIKASSLFPNHASSWSRQKDDGRAEALLIAGFGV